MIWFLIGLIGFIHLINKLTLNYGFKNLTYNMEINKRTAEIGEEIEVCSIVENNKPLSISFLKVSEKFPNGFNIEKNIYTLFIMPFQRVRRIYKITGIERGLYTIKYVSLELGDFIGFEMKYEEIELHKQIIIFPQKLELKESISPIGSLNGDISVKRWIIDDPLMTIGIREYTGNEPERFIHWPSSLKYGSLMVKNFDFTTDNSVVVLLNIESTKPYWKDTRDASIEKSISLARAVMEELEELKISYGFACNAYKRNSNHVKDHFYHPGLGTNHLNHFLEILGSINYIISSTFEKTLKDISRKQGNYTTIVIITPDILESYVNPINNLSKVVTKTVVISVDEGHLSRLNNNIVKYRSV